MNISFDWLKEYVDIEDMTPQELDDLLTFSGLEVDSMEKVETIKGGLEHVVIAQVLTCEPHPDSDHLHLTTVDVGGERPLNIVCGAPNVAAGQKVVCAQIGTKIYTSDTEYYEIKKGKLRGAVSEGMLCAADELQLGTDHAGIMVLPDDAPVGMPAKEYFHVKDDCLLEVAITANRMDAISHIGVARDVVSVRNTREGECGANTLTKQLKIKWPEVATDLTPKASGEPIKVTVEEPDLCPRYTGITLRNVKVGESPEWLQNRLRTVGLRPINNVVDATNFVMMEVGQPLHAFDADQIAGGHVIVKRLPQGTKFVTLDGVERTLDARDLMICNEQEGMCIAGVFGGLKSGTTMETKNVFLESAFFNPVSIRKTSQRHTLKTDASYRYERTCDPNITEWALRRAVKLIQELAGGEICGQMVDVVNSEFRSLNFEVQNSKFIIRPVEVNFRRMFDLVGQDIPLEAVRTALTSLDIEIVNETAEGMTLKVPTCKADVTRECDIVEEILRIYGYNNIHISETVNSCLSYGKKPDPRKLKNAVSDYLTDNGFSEIMNNSLTKSELYDDNPDFPADRCVQILNPLSKELNVMRQTLLYSGLECIARNINFRILDQKLYEFGRSYVKADLKDLKDSSDLKELPVTKRFNETEHVSIFMTGNMTPESWKMKPAETDFFYLKAYVMDILHRMRVNMGRVEMVPSQYKFFAEGLDIIQRDSKKLLGTVGRIGRETLKKMDIKQPVYYADLNWTLLLKQYPTKEVLYQEVAKFPEVRRDLALVLKKDVTFAQVEQAALQCEKKLLKSVNLFDVYEGKGIAEGFKSYAVSFILQDKDKTLNDKQIEATMSKIQKTLETQLGAKIRG